MTTHGAHMELQVQERGAVALVTFRAVTLARPLISELSRTLDGLEENPRVRMVIFTGQRKVFMTGADRSELASLRSSSDVEDFLRLPHDLLRRFISSRKLLIAAINGYCLGGGLEFALACDFRTCAADLKSSDQYGEAIIGFPEAALGVVPAVGGVQLALDTVGRSNARKLLFSSTPISAQQAHTMGLVDVLFPPETLINDTERWICSLLSRSSDASLLEIKRLLNEQMLTHLGWSLASAKSSMTRCCQLADKDARLTNSHADACFQFKSATTSSRRLQKGS